jgi:hypothetical protein
VAAAAAAGGGGKGAAWGEHSIPSAIEESKDVMFFLFSASPPDCGLVTSQASVVTFLRPLGL